MRPGLLQGRRRQAGSRMGLRLWGSHRPRRMTKENRLVGVGWGQGGWAGGPGSRCEASVQPPRGPGSRPVRGRFPAHLPQPLSQPLGTETSFRCQKEPSPTGPPRVLPSPGWPCSPCGSGRKEGRRPGRQWPSSPLGAWLAPLACACGSFWLLLPLPHALLSFRPGCLGAIPHCDWRGSSAARAPGWLCWHFPRAVGQGGSGDALGLWASGQAGRCGHRWPRLELALSPPGRPAPRRGAKRGPDPTLAAALAGRDAAAASVREPTGLCSRVGRPEALRTPGLPGNDPSSETWGWISRCGGMGCVASWERWDAGSTPRRNRQNCIP